MDPTHWHAMRGTIMIVNMKAISFTTETLSIYYESDVTSTPYQKLFENFLYFRMFSWLAYALCPASLMFGPWFGFACYSRHVWPSVRMGVSGRSDYTDVLYLFIGSLIHTSKSFLCALFCLLYSTCLSQVLLPDFALHPWLYAYVTSQSFRFSHYFVSYASEAFVTSYGIRFPVEALKPRNSERRSSSSRLTEYIHVTHMLNIEFPRSLADVVVNWNLPMHSWLKQYVYKPTRPFGHVFSVLATYTTSALLHGLNFQLSAVLFSIGLFAFVEFLLREKLAYNLSACISSRPCAFDCGHVNRNAFWVHCCNLFFGFLAAFHLAYLAAAFDTSEQQFHGYSIHHTLRKWSHLGFLNHFVAFSTFVFYKCIS
ncbi:O-palmitoleoyl transferase [Paragonimus westermani]|uniref:Protein-serine O-palmitoleoyltransferase porcupine n=1 Tax=Paragonimus westermani TaxID=34504 RepID=A0A5J4P1Y6_9TREM|nr:O-palmitoleoyl transferase [Paragonimus westermani]